MRQDQAGFATRAIHAGYDPAEAQGALTPPLHLTSTFAFESAEAGGEMFAGTREGHFYSRISNPTTDLLERRLASLEGAEAAVATASGMGAITATLWSFLKAGDEVITDQTLYGCTFAFLRDGLTRFGGPSSPAWPRDQSEHAPRRHRGHRRHRAGGGGQGGG